MKLPPVAILCGGKGTRLGSLTKYTPKSLVEVAGRPFIRHQLDLLAKQGVTDVVLCVGHLGNQIEEEVGLLSYGGMTIHYVFDDPDVDTAGTASVIADALPLLGKTFFVMYGDSYLTMDLERIVLEAETEDANVCRVLWEGTDYGITLFRNIAEWPSEAGKDINWVVGEFAKRGEKVCFLNAPSRFYQIGDPAGLQELNAMLSEEAEGPFAPSSFTEAFLQKTARVASLLPKDDIDALVDELALMRELGGRLFIIGVGGSAANASHAVNDFRKLCDIEAYAPTDNVAELTARTNDNGWRGVFADTLAVSKFSRKDVLLVLSVGGGMEEAPGTSVNIAYAVMVAKRLGARVLGIVGRDGGYTLKHADACVLVPTVDEALITPMQESMQSVVLHLLVSHPTLKKNPTKW